jgi:hypothetical protein
MLVRLLPSQVSNNWDVIAETIKRSLPPTQVWDDGVEERLLKAVYDGRLACWVYVREKDVVCVVTTTISTDFCTGQKTLLIFSMYSILEMNQSEWFAGIDFLRKHAKSIGCVNLIAYTTNKSLGRVLREKVAANTEWILLKMEV